MKRRDLEKRLRHAGCYLKREGGSHSLWTNPRTGVVEAVPRHTEIAAIRRTNGGLPTLGQVFVTLSPTLDSWRTLEFLSWQVRDWSRAGRCIQIRTRGLPPVIREQIQLGSSLRVIFDFFVCGLDADPERMLRELDEFAKDLDSSLRLYGPGLAR